MENKIIKEFIFLIAPTSSNKRNFISKKYQFLKNEIKKRNINVIIKYSFFPINLIIKKRYYLFIRESVSLYPLLILLSVFQKRFILEINGNPVADSINNKIIRNIFFFIRDKIVQLNKNCKIYCYSKDEGGFFKTKRAIYGYNCLERKFIRAQIPRSKNVLMLIGNSSNWHGVDKIKYLAKIFKEYSFYIYGANNDNTDYKNIHFSPYGDINKIMKERSYGYALGSLNYSKKFGSVKTNSSLKGVLYHFLDLPFIQSFDEYGSSKNFTLNIGNINKIERKELKKIDNFFNYWKNKNIDLSDIDKFSPRFAVNKIINSF